MDEETFRKIIKEVVDESIETKTRAIVQEVVDESIETKTRAIVQEVVDESIETKTRAIVQEIVDVAIEKSTDKIMDMMVEYSNATDSRLDVLESDVSEIKEIVADIKDTIGSYPVVEQAVRIAYRNELDDHGVRIKRLETHLALP